MCGSKRIQLEAVSVPVGKGKTATVEAQVCLVCGEQYFDRAAMQTLEAAEGIGRRPRRRRSTA